MTGPTGKQYGPRERLWGAITLIFLGIRYLFNPRKVEITLLRALQLRKDARVQFHGLRRANYGGMG
jgi:hypothetical protein